MSEPNRVGERMAAVLRSSKLGKLEQLPVRTATKILYGLKILSYGDRTEPTAVVYEPVPTIVEEDVRRRFRDHYTVLHRKLTVE